MNDSPTTDQPVTDAVQEAAPVPAVDQEARPAREKKRGAARAAAVQPTLEKLAGFYPRSEERRVG